MEAPPLSQAVLDNPSDDYHKYDMSQSKTVIPGHGDVVDYAKHFPSTFKGKRAEREQRILLAFVHHHTVNKLFYFTNLRYSRFTGSPMHAAPPTLRMRYLTLPLLPDISQVTD